MERKERRKDALLSFDERPEKVSRRYAEVERAGEQIRSLLEENRLLFQVSEEMEEAWQRYVAYVDGIVIESLRRAVGCSLGERWTPCLFSPSFHLTSDLVVQLFVARLHKIFIEYLWNI